jgi:Arm DNA-binding domain
MRRDPCATLLRNRRSRTASLHFARDCPSFIHQYQAIVTGGEIALGDDRIQFDFKFEGRRYRPTLLITPTALNLRRARESLARIKARIAARTFSFADEFPDYRHLRKVVDSSEIRTCNQGVSRSEFISVLSRLQVPPMQESVDEASTGARLLPTVKPAVLNASPLIRHLASPALPTHPRIGQKIWP